jgi:hypothetical protein
MPKHEPSGRIRMDDICITCLTEIVKSTPPTHWLDSNQLHEALTAKCNGRGVERQVELITQGLAAGVPQALLRLGTPVKRETVNELVQRIGLDALDDGNGGRWVIAIWAVSLGFASNVKELYDNDFQGVGPSECSQSVEATPAPDNVVGYNITKSGDLVRAQGKSTEIVSQMRVWGASASPKGAPPEKRTRRDAPKRPGANFGQVKGLYAFALIACAGILCYCAMNLKQYSSHFVVAALVCAIVAFVFVLIKTCPACKSTNISVTGKQEIRSYYLHQRKDGGADRRYSYNPLIRVFRIFHNCSSCKHDWETTEEH